MNKIKVIVYIDIYIYNLSRFLEGQYYSNYIYS